MDFKISVYCQRCECSFELRPKEFKECADMECPNCGQAFPSDVYAKLKTGVIALGNVPEFLEEEHPDSLFTVRVIGFGNLNELCGSR